MSDIGTKTIETGDEIAVTFLRHQSGRGGTETIVGDFVGVCVDLEDGEPLLLIDEGGDCPESVGFKAVTRLEATDA